MEAGCASRAGNSMEAADVLHFISVAFYWSPGRWGLLVYFPSSHERKSSQSLGDCQLGRCFSPLVAQIVCGDCPLVFYTLQPHGASSSEGRTLVGFQCCACPACLPTPSTPQRAAIDENTRVSTHCPGITQSVALAFDIVARVYGNFLSLRLCASYSSAHARGRESILTWTPVATGLYEFLHQKNWVRRPTFQMKHMICSNCLSTDCVK